MVFFELYFFAFKKILIFNERIDINVGFYLYVEKMITIPECFYRVSVKALILDESGERFLLFQESDGKWDFP